MSLKELFSVLALAVCVALLATWCAPAKAQGLVTARKPFQTTPIAPRPLVVLPVQPVYATTCCLVAPLPPLATDSQIPVLMHWLLQPRVIYIQDLSR